MLVGISEAICLLLFNTILNTKDLVYQNNNKEILNSLYKEKNNEPPFGWFWETPLGFHEPPFNMGGSKKAASCFPVKFNEWLAGLIDGDGCFQLNKKGYASLEIVLELRDKHALYQIKQKFGGSIKLRSGINWLRYRLHHKKGIIKIINAINGEIRNPIDLFNYKKFVINMVSI